MKKLPLMPMPPKPQIKKHKPKKKAK